MHPLLVHSSSENYTRVPRLAFNVQIKWAEDLDFRALGAANEYSVAEEALVEAATRGTPPRPLLWNAIALLLVAGGLATAVTVVIVRWLLWRG